MPASKAAPLPRTTVPYTREKCVPDCDGHITCRNLVALRDAVTTPIHLAMEGIVYKPRKAPMARDLTPTSLAVLVDDDHDGLLMLPAVLHLGGDIGQVDSHGRTLLHFARSRRVARYLIEQGVPVAPGTRDVLLEAFNKPAGQGTFARNVRLGVRDHRGRSPAILACVRHHTAARYATPDSPVIPPERWKATLPRYVFDGMEDLGFDQIAGGRSGHNPQARRPTLRAALAVDAELDVALRECEPARVRALLALGADGKRPRCSHEVDFGQGFRSVDGFSATARAVLSDCDFIEDERRINGVHRKVKNRDLYLPGFPGHVDLSGIHGPGGRTLMHLAREKTVAEWLISHGAPCNGPDDMGRLPGDVLPPEVAAIVNAHMLATRLQGASAAATASRKRL
ncbi:hypothetical protein KPL74_08885 [Bacillus sp. NP157]|nr:hypothetical protein KPL74_08885 [Bacillus sp. NP157]